MQESRVTRTWEQPEDAIVCYGEIAQIVRTQQEIYVQFYETIPSIPDSSGRVDTVRCRLRATVVLSKAHATRLGHLLLESDAAPSPQ